MNLEATLRRDPHIKAIEPGEVWIVPDINYANFAAEDREDVEHAVRRIHDYLCSPYIIDDFTDHKKRRVWREPLWDQYPGMKKILDRNSLRSNRMNQAANFADGFAELYIGPNQELVEARTEDVFRYAQDKRRYDAMSTPDKIVFAKKFKSVLFKLLDALTQNPASP